MAGVMDSRHIVTASLAEDIVQDLPFCVVPDIVSDLEERGSGFVIVYGVFSLFIESEKSRIR